MLSGPPAVTAKSASSNIFALDLPEDTLPVAPFPEAKAYKVTFQDYFMLHVSAATTAISNSPIWAEAEASTTGKPVKNLGYSWYVNLSGNITWDPKANWSRTDATGVLPPKFWVPVTQPVEEKQKLDIANKALNNGQWVSK
jgi:hypothetical protein